LSSPTPYSPRLRNLFGNIDPTLSSAVLAATASLHRRESSDESMCDSANTSQRGSVPPSPSKGQTRASVTQVQSIEPLGLDMDAFVGIASGDHQKLGGPLPRAPSLPRSRRPPTLDTGSAVRIWGIRAAPADGAAEEKPS
jgi:hypothetical protein